VFTYANSSKWTAAIPKQIWFAAALPIELTGVPQTLLIKKKMREDFPESLPLYGGLASSSCG
jgi:hypothetical protein